MSASLFSIAALSALTFSTVDLLAAPPQTAWAGPGHVDARQKVIHVRKLARLVLGLGSPTDDASPVRIGPIHTRLFWQKGWKWNETALDTRLNLGLQGGPMLSVDLPLGVPGRVLSLETRLCALRYAFVQRNTRRVISEELKDPKRYAESIEAGVYLNVAFGGVK